MDKQSNNAGLHFDELKRPLPLHLILSTRSGSFIREIPADTVRLHETLTNGSEISFTVHREKCVDENGDVDIRFWRKIKDLKLVYCKELDRFYELRVNLSESDDTVKSVTAISLGEAEASQCNLYGIEINTEADIARDDYKPSVLYNEEDKSRSIVDRLIVKMPHYQIGEVGSRVRDIQRTFRFDGKSVYDACQDVGKEIGCLFQFECKLGAGHKISRTIHVRDMLCTCDEPGCGARGDFAEVCEKCGSTNIHRGYGYDTPIYISKENLAENIEYEADVDSVKNCFRLIGGDELMTAAIIAQNPNGSQYLWYITDEMREDMSDELRERLEAYDDRYAYYQNEYAVPSFESNGVDLRERYNSIVKKYAEFNSDLKLIMGADGTEDGQVVGYPAIMEAYYNTIDLELYLRSGLMPSVELASTDAAQEAAKLTRAKLSPAAVSNLDTCSATTAANAVLGTAKCLVRQSFSIKVNSSAYNPDTHTWTGNFLIKNYSDEEDTAISPMIEVEINGDMEQYIRQKMTTAMSRDQDDPTDITDLFALGNTAFARELKKYCLKKLEEFRSSCQVCLDVMIQHGVTGNSLSEELSNTYHHIYLPYREKMAAIENEILTRDSEIAAITASRDENGNVIEDGLQSILVRLIEEIHKAVNFEDFVGEDLLKEFASYRRDDTYENTNYISDGLDNKALFQMADAFLTAAKYEIARAARVYHSIKATLSNLLQMKEFLPIIDDFKVGNRLRVRVDDKLYVLRMIEFEVDYDNFELSVVFSDVMDIGNSVGDIAEILGNARSISTSYNAVAHQAEAGKKSSDMIANIAENGLKLTTHIVGGAHDQEFLLDESGYLGRTYLPETGSYSPEQIRIISNGIYITDDAWETMKAALGKFQYYNPERKQVETGFGVIAEQLVGNMLLTNSAGIYNENGSVVIDDKGVQIVVDEENNTNAITIERKNHDGSQEKIFYVDGNGDLVIKGKIEALLGEIGGFTIGESALYNGGKSSIAANTDGVYLGTDGIALGKGTFQVTNGGSMTAKAGTIGGFTIGATELKNSNQGYRQYTVGFNTPGRPSQSTIAIWAGTPVAAAAAPFYVQYDGSMKATKGSIGGFTISDTAIYNNILSADDNSHDGVYIGTDGIVLGKGKFKVTDAGAVSAKSGTIGGFTIGENALYNGSKSTIDANTDGVYLGTDGISLGKGTFKVTDAGKVTASDINITGGSISIKNGSDIVFQVNESGDAYFSGKVNVGQLVGYISADQLNDAVNEALGHAVKYGELEDLLGQTYSDVNEAINSAVGYAVDYNTFNQAISDIYGNMTNAIKNAIGYATNYNNATQQNPSSYPDYFCAGMIVAKNSFYSDDYYVDTGNDATEFNLSNHYHQITADSETGVVTIGRPVKGDGQAPSFNIADTEFFKRAVSAAGGGSTRTATVTWTDINGNELSSTNNSDSVAFYNTYKRSSVYYKIQYDDGSSPVIGNFYVNTYNAYQAGLVYATPTSIDRRTNLASGNPMPDTWSNGKGYIYVRAQNSDGQVYKDATIEVTTDSAIYQAGLAAGGGTVSVSKLDILSASGYAGTSATKTISSGSRESGVSNQTFTATGSIKLNDGTTYDNVPIDITGITQDIYLYSYSTSVKSCTNNRLYLRSNYEIRLKTDSGSQKLLDVYDESSGNSVDISSYVNGGTTVNDISISSVDGVLYSTSPIEKEVYVGKANTNYNNGELQGGVAVTFSDGTNTVTKNILVKMSTGKVPSGGTTSVNISSIGQYSYSSSADYSVSFDNGYLRYSNGYLNGRALISFSDGTSKTVYIQMDGSRVPPSGTWSYAIQYNGGDQIIVEEEPETINFGSNVTYNSSGYLVGDIIISHGSANKEYYIRMNTDQVPTSGGGTQNRYVTGSTIVPGSSYTQIKLTYNSGADQTIALPNVWNSYIQEYSSIYELGYWAGREAAGGGGSGDDPVSDDGYSGYGSNNPPSWFNSYQGMGWNARYDGYSVNYARTHFDNDYYADEINDWEYGWYEANYHITGSRY